MALAVEAAASARGRVRSRLAVLGALISIVGAVAVMPLSPVRAQNPSGVLPPGPPAQTDVILDGRGFGHGVGMAQDGAYALGVAGKSTQEILASFYPGTVIGKGGGTINVSLDSPQPAIDLAFPEGGQVLDASSGPQSPGFPITVAPGGRVRLSFDGGLYHAFPGSQATPAPTTPPTTAAPATVPMTAAPLPGQVPGSTAAPTSTTPPPPAVPTEPRSSRPLWAVPPKGAVVAVAATGRQYRGVIEASGSGGGLQLVNRIDVEQYLRGMGEVREPGWPAASLRSQAIAARTYALRSAGGVLCSTDQCQVYLGATAEYPAMDAAVAATYGQVVRFRGALADTVYSANGGGFTATPEEGFGAGDSDTPYLRAVPYPSLDPEPWNMRTSLADMAGRFGYGGKATGVHVSRSGPSGRALEILFEGDHGALAVDGQRFQSVLKLRSSLFTLRVEEPPPPPDPINEAAPPVVGQQVRISPPPSAADLTPPQSVNGRRWIALALLLLVGSTSATRRVSKRKRSHT